MRSLYDRVVAFVARHLGVSADDLKPDTTLFGDLNADSDDGVELLEEFAREFSVDMSGYDPSRYFGTENLPFWLSLWWLIPNHPRREAGRSIVN
jgi:acyl carrier protein